MTNRWNGKAHLRTDSLDGKDVHGVHVEWISIKISNTVFVRQHFAAMIVTGVSKRLGKCVVVVPRIKKLLIRTQRIRNVVTEGDFFPHPRRIEAEDKGLKANVVEINGMPASSERKFSEQLASKSMGKRIIRDGNCLR